MPAIKVSILSRRSKVFRSWSTRPSPSGKRRRSDQERPSPWPQAACLRVSTRGLGVFNIVSSPGRWHASSFMNFNAPPLILTHRLDWKSAAPTYALAAGEWRPNKTGTRERGSFGAVEKRGARSIIYRTSRRRRMDDGTEGRNVVCRLDLADDLVHVLSGFTLLHNLGSTSWRVHASLPVNAKCGCCASTFQQAVGSRRHTAKL